TRLLLEELSRTRKIRYLPVDISAAALGTLGKNLAQWLPDLDLMPLQAEYFAALDSLRGNGRPKLVLFLGSNIGNFTHVQTIAFLRHLQASLLREDCLLTGFDLKKDPQRILAAYNDSQHVTRDFSRNLLHRINNELGGNFVAPDFDFYPSYNPETGEMHAFLISTRDQDVRIEALDLDLHFIAWETIHTEVSRKYDLPLIESLAAESGFKVIGHFHDPNQDFVDSLWRSEQ
ncbi:MAG: L-histidine N(alpha)-methyltransferase, partial [Candidatus Sericytochromatia bacterium]